MKCILPKIVNSKNILERKVLWYDFQLKKKNQSFENEYETYSGYYRKYEW